MYGNPEFDLYEAIYTTRSMRRLKPEPVAPELLVKVIEAATMGPSGHNRQPWYFIVVTDPETKQFVAVRYLTAWERIFTPVERQVVATDPQSQRGRNLRSAKYLAEHLADVPVMIFACVKKYTDRARAGQPMWGAIYPAVQNLCLAARGYGLGSSITGMHTMFASEIDARLGVPPEYANVLLIPIGYPKGRWARPDRKPVMSVTFWERWGIRREGQPG
ncbi:MAG TPA: nitroreductase family protein [Candidatus Acidoferrales bacterium]|nr:nitroreductase family protein [Candidatus Acidoferrales bacterium]